VFFAGAKKRENLGFRGRAVCASRTLCGRREGGVRGHLKYCIIWRVPCPLSETPVSKCAKCAFPGTPPKTPIFAIFGIFDPPARKSEFREICQFSIVEKSPLTDKKINFYKKLFLIIHHHTANDTRFLFFVIDKKLFLIHVHSQNFT
jgi:hypothetical protein